MSDLSGIFKEGAKVVISPDKMRAWVTLPPPAKGVVYSAETITEWLPQNGVVFGADGELIRKAAQSKRYDELLEVARGRAPVAAAGGSYTLLVEKKPFTGLRANGDGSLIYDDLSFLQEVPAGQPLAEIVPATQAVTGMTVTGEEVAPREGTAGKTLEGSGFVVSEDGRQYRAPVLSHVGIVNDQLVVTPLKKLEKLTPEDGVVEFDGNVLVQGDVLAGSTIKATGSVFVVGRAVSSNIEAGNNLLLCEGMRSESGFAHIEAKGHVWGLFFESCEIVAGGDICANHLTGCEVRAGGRASILGGRGSIGGTNLYAQNGVVAGQLGGDMGGDCTISAGMNKELIDRYNAVDKKVERLTIDIQALQQNITAHERVNRMKADKGRTDAGYKEMVSKRDQSLSVLNILNNERTRLKRTMDQYATISIIAKDVAAPGTTVVIDTRAMTLKMPMRRTKFRRSGETIEAVTMGG